MRKGKKISILGAGNVGASIAYALTINGLASEIVLVDINTEKAKGEAMDILQGTAFCPSVDIYAGDYPDTADSDIVVITVGQARKPGQTRIDLAQNNVNIIKSVAPQIVKYAPNAIYIMVSNPVDILTYAMIKYSGLPERQIIGSGTMLDTTRLRTAIAGHVELNPRNVHAYVFGEHGDSLMVPWSLVSIAGMTMPEYCGNDKHFSDKVLTDIAEDVKTSGAQVIALKGATYYAVALSVCHICDVIIRDIDSALTVSAMVNGQYGIEDVCLSLPFVVGCNGIIDKLTPPLQPDELAKLQASANSLKEIIAALEL